MSDIALVILLMGFIILGAKTKMYIFFLIASAISIHTAFVFIDDLIVSVALFGLSIALVYFTFFGPIKS